MSWRGSTRRSRHRGLAMIVIGILGALALAPSAFGDTINLTRFSKAVSGTADTGVTNVTVDLLRNTISPTSGVAQRGQIDTCMATVGAGGAWSCSFATHQFAGPNDLVEVDYTGGGAQVTIGGNGSLAGLPAQTAPNTFVRLSADALDGSLGISTDGSTLECDADICNGGTFTATVSGTKVATKPVANTLTLGAAGTVTDSTPVTVTATDTVVNPNNVPGKTIVTLTDSAPLLTPITADGVTSGPDDIDDLPEPVCSAYLVTSEVVCTNLAPGSYTLTAGSSTPQTLTVPAVSTTGDFAYSGGEDFPSQAGAAVAGLTAGESVTLSAGTRVLTKLVVETPTIATVTPLGDPLNGARTVAAGSCAGDLYFANDSENGGASQAFGDGAPLLCTGPSLPSPSNLGRTSLFLNEDGLNGLFGLQDEFGGGASYVDMPQVSYSEPGNGTSVRTPYTVIGQLNYDDPLTQVASNDTAQPVAGENPVVLTKTSTDSVTFAYAPLNSTAFTTLGNVNVAGGLALPAALTPGWYQGAWTVKDARGDSYTYESTFYDQGVSSTPAPTTPTCTAKGSHGFKASTSIARATIAKAKKGKKHKKHKKHKKKSTKTPATSTLKLTCSGSSATAGVLAVTLDSGATTVASGSGVISGGATKITVSGPFKKGTYTLVKVITANGTSSVASQTVTLKK